MAFIENVYFIDVEFEFSAINPRRENHLFEQKVSFEVGVIVADVGHAQEVEFLEVDIFILF